MIKRRKTDEQRWKGICWRRFEIVSGRSAVGKARIDKTLKEKRLMITGVIIINIALLVRSSVKYLRVPSSFNRHARNFAFACVLLSRCTQCCSIDYEYSMIRTCIACGLNVAVLQCTIGMCGFY